MIRIGFLADTHLGYDLPVNPRIQRRRRGTDFQNNYERALRELAGMGSRVIVHGGDVFFRSKVPDSIQAQAYEPLLRIAEQGIRVLLVPGNHERSRLPWTPLFHHPNVIVFHDPKTVCFDLDGYTIAFGGYPFLRHRSGPSWPELIRRMEILEVRADYRIVCAHQAFHGARVGPVDWMFRKGADVVGLDQIPTELPLVLSGHIHRRQILTTPAGSQVVYPGSIERTAFAEEGETKGYASIDLKDDMGRLQAAIAFHDLPARPMIRIQLPDSLNPSSVAEYVEWEIRQIPADAVVRVMAHSDEQAVQISAERLRTIAPESMNIELRIQNGKRS